MSAKQRNKNYTKMIKFYNFSVEFDSLRQFFVKDLVLRFIFACGHQDLLFWLRLDSERGPKNDPNAKKRNPCTARKASHCWAASSGIFWALVALRPTASASALDLTASAWELRPRPQITH